MAVPPRHHLSATGVDVGGTFTDTVHWDGTQLIVAKESTVVGDEAAGVAGGIAAVGADRTRLLHGTTVATNALLERRGAKTLLITDAGFSDVLEIGRQDRPSLYDTFSDRPTPLAPKTRRVGVSAPVSVADADAACESLLAILASAEAVAVCFLGAYEDQTPELLMREALARHTQVPVSVSSEVSAEFREYERTSTTVINAYLQPRVGGYLADLAGAAGLAGSAPGMSVMRSSGGMMGTEAAAALPAAVLLSGPAGGVVAGASLGHHLGIEHLITFDMGGTSTDVCRIEGGEADLSYERSIGGYACRLPSVAINTVGAGGGSVAWIDAGGALRVGPRSAGADPGPACYGRGGLEPTVTDANLILGRLDPASPLAGSLTLRRDLAEAALAAVAEPAGLSVEEAALGVIAVVESNMAAAIRAASVEEGFDPRQATLMAFGGAGGLHATALARALGMGRVVLPPHAGVFSALGLLLAAPRYDAARTVTDASQLDSHLAELGDQASARLPAKDRVAVSFVLDMRYRGQAHELAVPYRPGTPPNEQASLFHEAHERRNGFRLASEPVEVITVRAAAVGEPTMAWDDMPVVAAPPATRQGARTVVTAHGTVTAAVVRRSDLGSSLTGPIIVEDDDATIYLGPDEIGAIGPTGELVITL